MPKETNIYLGYMRKLQKHLLPCTNILESCLFTKSYKTILVLIVKSIYSASNVMLDIFVIDNIYDSD